MLGGDLEESVFQRNVPGKFSHWDRGDDEGRRNDSGDEGDNNEEEDANYDSLGDKFRGSGDKVTTDKLLSDSSIPDYIKNGILNERSQKHNTGVKVICRD